MALCLKLSLGPYIMCANRKGSSEKVNRKVQEEPQAEVADTRRKRKVTQINVCIANNKCTIGTKTSAPFPKQGDQNAKRTEETHRQRAGKTKHEAPRSVNYRATPNKNNIGTTALERSVVYITGGFKGLSLYKLHPGSRYNS